ncbi:MAG: c-type cytochrome [candidate division NC10 bacterium]|nr:c-type cytochrome [candidate division NC10 bacterium]
MRKVEGRVALVAGLLALGFLAAGLPGAEQPGGVGGHGTAGGGDAHGTPEGWTFRLPEGDPKAGRRAFVDFECYKCHPVAGENFPRSEGTGDVGPDLSRMGPLHPAEYFAEAILNPNAVLTEGPGFLGPDGKSRMPSYTESMTLQQLIDLVAYLGTLGAGASAPAGGGGHGATGGGHTGH